MRRILFIIAIVAIWSSTVVAVAEAELREVRPFVGAFIPTGSQRDFLKDVVLVGAQGGMEISERAHLIGTLAWAPRKTERDVTVYAYDIGVETFRPFWMNESWQFRPFVGAGLGARTYVDHLNGDHREINPGGYGTLGAEFQLDRTAIRLEGRDYVSRFKGLRGDAKAELRNDVAIVTGVALHW